MMENCLKSVSTTANEMRVANYMVLFGGSDLTGEFFTKNTNFRSNYTDLGAIYVDFEHGMDPDKTGNTPHDVLGLVDWKSMKVDETGVYVERILSRQAKYFDFLGKLIEAGVIGTSSAAIPGMTRKKSTGEITDWPLMRDSLTATPMEPRMLGENVLYAARSLAEMFPHSKALAQLVGAGVESIERITSLREAEDYLRDAGGLSRTEAKALIARLSGLGRRDADEDDVRQLLQRRAVFA